MVDIGRRQFLRGGAVAAASVATATVLPVQESKATGANALIDYPSNRLGNIADLKVNEPIDINYPDENSPGILLKIGQPVEGGVGPDSDIVAYSVLCPHKGWLMAYRTDDKTLNCPGHFSRFDCEAGGQQVWGHATQNVPQFTLIVDDKGDIYAEGASDLIFGRPSNVL
jgi:arsenite oxidase small subunit